MLTNHERAPMSALAPCSWQIATIRHRGQEPARCGQLLTDAQWEKIRPLLPKRPKRPRGGRPRAADHKVLEGILWILRSGARIPTDSAGGAGRSATQNKDQTKFA